MIATWMLYTTLVGILATVAAVGLEQAGRALGVQVRWAWVAALATTLLWPVVINGRVAHRAAPLPHLLDVAAPDVAPVSGVASSVAVPTVPALPGRPDSLATIAAAADRLDPWLIALWAASSLFILVQLARSIGAIRRGRMSWKPHVVDGAPVLLSNDVGPAVIGLRDLRIVLPQWTLALEPPFRAVILAHEGEHRRARDPYLLLGAILATALAPWNLAIWWQCKRLRLAIETDCDARVLEREQDVQGYGSVLVTIAERRGPRTPAIATALTESISNLERRIAVMTTPVPRFPKTTAAILTAFAVGAIALAVIAPVPAAFAAARRAQPTTIQEPSGQAALAPASSSPAPAKRVFPTTRVDVQRRPTPPTAGAFDPRVGDSVVRGGTTADGALPLTTGAGIPSISTTLTADSQTPRANILIRGTVHDASGVKIENASVTAITETNERGTTKTRADGRFTLSVPAIDGIYVLSFSASGFAPRSVQVKRRGVNDTISSSPTESSIGSTELSGI